MSSIKGLSKWDEDKLLKCNFSKLEIEQWLKDARKLYEKDYKVYIDYHEL